MAKGKTRWGKIIIQALIVTALFTLLDYIIHWFGILPELESLPDYYFLFKIITVPLILIAMMGLLRIKDGFLLCIIPTVLLQGRYLFLNIYDIPTNLLMVVLHYFMILASFSILNLKIFKIGGKI